MLTLDGFGRPSETISVIPWKLSGIRRRIWSWTLPSFMFAAGCCCFLCQYIEASLKIRLNLWFLSFCSQIISCCIKKKESGLWVTSSSILCSMEDFYRVSKLIRCLISWSIENTEIKNTCLWMWNQKGSHDNALAHLLWRVIYVTSFNKRSYLRNLVNHWIERV